MDTLFVLERARDGKRVDFYVELRGGKMTYIIREHGNESQDSVTTDRSAVDTFREGLLRDGYMEMPVTDR